MFYANLFFACAQAVSTVTGQAGNGMPDVVVVVLDDVHQADLDASCTPNLDAFPGAYFSRAYTTPTCSPSRYAMLYGRYPHREGIGSWLSMWDQVRPDPSRRSLQDVLGGAGFTTHAIGKWHLGIGGPNCRTEDARVHGFDHWRAGTFANLPNSLGTWQYDDWYRIDNGYERYESRYSATVIVDEAIRAYENPGPDFVWVSLHSAHSPFHEPPPGLYCGSYDFSTGYGQYLAMISAADQELGRLFAAIDWSSTIVLVVGDNGTPPHFLPDGRGKMTPYQRGVHVPMWFWAPGGPTAKQTNLVHLVDVPATLAGFLGIRHPWEDSRDALFGGRQMLYIANFRNNLGLTRFFYDGVAILDQPYMKLIVKDRVHEELYDLANDPFEKTPLDLDDPSYADALTKLRVHVWQVGGPEAIEKPSPVLGKRPVR